MESKTQTRMRHMVEEKIKNYAELEQENTRMMMHVGVAQQVADTAKVFLDEIRDYALMMFRSLRIANPLMVWEKQTKLYAHVGNRYNVASVEESGLKIELHVYFRQMATDDHMMHFEVDLASITDYTPVNIYTMLGVLSMQKFILLCDDVSLVDVPLRLLSSHHEALQES